MARGGVERGGVRQFDDAAEIHDGDAARDVFHNPQVVRNEEIGDAERGL